MVKLLPKQYPKRECLTFAQIQKEVLDLVNNIQHGTFLEELDYLLNSFENLIWSSRFQGGYGGFYDVYKDDIKQTNQNIKQCIKYYLQGKTSSCFNSFNKHWDKLWKDNYTPNLYDVKQGDVWYKIRKVDKYPYSLGKDFFHVPFDMRGIIGNNRYSISGFPCLYLGKSIYTCWEEMKRPKNSEIAAAAFKVAKPIKLLDMRLLQEIDSSHKEWYNIRLLPYILASSIKTHGDNDNFKPEYIIPQLILHSVIKYKAYDGVIFTSTRRGFPCTAKSISIYDNLAIPVLTNRIKGHCKELASYFKVSIPVYFEYEYLKGLIHGENLVGERNKYSNTVFHSLEEILKNNPFNPILDEGR